MQNEFGKRTDYLTECIGDGVYRICDFGVTECYLVIGKEKALLIDVGTGMGDLLGAVRKITDLPLMVVVTHSHTDHLGGKGQFPEIYVHKDDITCFTWLGTSVAVRRAFIKFNGVADKTIKMKDIRKGEVKTTLKPIDNAGFFDLGERDVKYKHLTGHTRGSIILFDDKTHIIFSGDNVCPCVWMFLAHSSSIEEWINSAKEILSYADDYKIYWGHEGGLLPKEIIGKVIAVGEEILRKYPKNSLFSRIVAYPSNDRVKGSIIFRTRNVWTKK